MKNRTSSVFCIFLVIYLAIFAWYGLAAAADRGIEFEWEHDGVDLAGFRLYYGLASGSYTNTVDIAYEVNADPAAPANAWVSKDFRIEAPADAQTIYYFAMTAFDAAGNESDFSNEISVLIDFKGPNKVFNLKIKVVEKNQ